MMVPRAMVMAGLAALLAACGGGGAGPDSTTTPASIPTQTNTPTPEVPAPETRGRLTLDEMRAWCTGFDERGGDKFAGVEETWGDAVEAFGWVQDELTRVNPPEELEEFWKAWQRGIEVSVFFTREKSAEEPFQIDELTSSSEFMAANRAFMTIQQGLEGEAYNVALYCTG